MYAIRSYYAQHVHVLGHGLEPSDVDLDGVLHAEGADDDVLVREVLDLLGRQLLHLDVVVEHVLTSYSIHYTKLYD